MGTTVVDPNGGAGYDYLELVNWESGQQGTITEPEIAKCRCTGGTADTTAFTIAGWTGVSSSNYIKIWTDTAESYRHAAIYPTGNKYRFEYTGASYGITLSEDYIRFEGIAFSHNVSSASYFFSVTSSMADLRISKCILKDGGGAAQSTGMFSYTVPAGGTLKAWNNIVYDTNYGFRIGGGDANSVTLYSNTMVDCTRGFRGAAETILINNISVGGTDNFYGNQYSSLSGWNITDLDPDAYSDGNFGADQKTGTTTGQATNKLIDSGGGLSSIRIGSLVKDPGTAYSYVTAIDSDTQLSLNDNLLGDADAYSIKENMYGNPTFQNEGADEFLLGSSDTVAIDKGKDLSGDTYLPFTDDILEYTRPYNSIWDVGAHEYEPGGVTINFTGTIDSVTLISGVTLYRTMNLSDTISAVFSVSGVTLYRIMDLTGTVDTISSLTCSELTIIYVLNPTSGGLAWGEENPTQSEIAAPWSVWSDGAGGTPTITGDQDWGILNIDTDDEGRSNVYDFGDSVSRTYVLTLNRYGSGSGTPVVQIRGQNTSFLQDDVSPSWETYSVPVAKTWRYVQVRIDYA